ncbi:iron-sulfur cluster assembly scaffold protein [Candidatus Woesearchaeota archaeon CG10_big_fil_rev_8_21_14_0_10_44_13]|nr:MAG: iron-sulfur cluster assembly scaffold protein [Candidatus Woesearchaeota archaeon CG10_big_fil_rev_8_21_14_0_10_44_13]
MQHGQYTKKVLDYFKNPKHAGDVKNASGVGQVGNPVCGDMMKISIAVKDDRISDIRFKTFGCVAAIGSTEALCRIAKGKKLADAKKITSKDIAKELGGLPGIKMHCSVLGADGLKKAIDDYEKKQRGKKTRK